MMNLLQVEALSLSLSAEMGLNLLLVRELKATRLKLLLNDPQLAKYIWTDRTCRRLWHLYVAFVPVAFAVVENTCGGIGISMSG